VEITLLRYSFIDISNFLLNKILNQTKPKVNLHLARGEMKAGNLSNLLSYPVTEETKGDIVTYAMETKEMIVLQHEVAFCLLEEGLNLAPFEVSAYHLSTTQPKIVSDQKGFFNLFVPILQEANSNQLGYSL